MLEELQDNTEFRSIAVEKGEFVLPGCVKAKSSYLESSEGYFLKPFGSQFSTSSLLSAVLPNLNPKSPTIDLERPNCSG